MKYHIPLNADQWLPSVGQLPLLEQQVVIVDFEDEYRLVVALCRSSPEGGMPFVQEARLEMRAGTGALAGQWQLVRHVRSRDLVLVEGAGAFTVLP